MREICFPSSTNFKLSNKTKGFSVSGCYYYH